jgi:benzylsuccinate CoA-transferase BbsF subunit
MAALPLAGIRVLDLGQVWAGPLLGVYLSDYGAEVIRVETLARSALQAGAARPTIDATSPVAYEGLGRNRRSVALNLASAAGHDLFLRLVAVSDIVFDNLSPRALRKLGIDYPSLRQVNERVIVASLSAAGQYGPWSDVLTYGPSLTALYGIKSLLGYAGESAIQEDVADLDPTAATYAMIALMAALRWRDRTGQGQFIDLAQGEAGVAALPEAVMEYTMNGRVLGPTGNRHRLMAPHGIYPTRGEDRWIAIAVENDAGWRALCTIAGEPQAATAPDLADMYSRLKHQDELDELVGRWTQRFTAEELTERLQQAGVASFPVLDALGVIADEQLAFRRSAIHCSAPGLEQTQMLTGTPWGLSESPAAIYGPTREIGADNAYVLAEILGLSRSQIEEEVSSGAIG